MCDESNLTSAWFNAEMLIGVLRLQKEIRLMELAKEFGYLSPQPEPPDSPNTEMVEYLAEVAKLYIPNWPIFPSDGPRPHPEPVGPVVIKEMIQVARQTLAESAEHLDKLEERLGSVVQHG